MQRTASHDSLRATTPGRSRNGVLSAWGRRDASAGTGGDAAWHAEWTGLQVGVACWAPAETAGKAAPQRIKRQSRPAGRAAGVGLSLCQMHWASYMLIDLVGSTCATSHALSHAPLSVTLRAAAAAGGAVRCSRCACAVCTLLSFSACSIGHRRGWTCLCHAHSVRAMHPLELLATQLMLHVRQAAVSCWRGGQGASML